MTPSMETQRRTFEVVRERGEGARNNLPRLEQDLGLLTQCVVTGNKLMINYVFGCIGVPRFLVNLKTKATGRLVDSIVKNSLGPLCDAKPMQTQRAGEKFVPARSTKKRGNSAVRKTGEATIEREASRVFGEGHGGLAFLLAREGLTVTFKYSRESGLRLETEIFPAPAPESKSAVAIKFSSKEEDEEVVDVEGGEASAGVATTAHASSSLPPSPTAAASSMPTSSESNLPCSGDVKPLRVPSLQPSLHSFSGSPSVPRQQLPRSATGDKQKGPFGVVRGATSASSTTAHLDTYAGPSTGAVASHNNDGGDHRMDYSGVAGSQPTYGGGAAAPPSAPPVNSRKQEKVTKAPESNPGLLRQQQLCVLPPGCLFQPSVSSADHGGAQQQTDRAKYCRSMSSREKTAAPQQFSSALLGSSRCGVKIGADGASGKMAQGKSHLHARILPAPPPSSEQQGRGQGISVTKLSRTDEGVKYPQSRSHGRPSKDQAGPSDGVSKNLAGDRDHARSPSGFHSGRSETKRGVRSAKARECVKKELPAIQTQPRSRSDPSPYIPNPPQLGGASSWEQGERCVYTALDGQRRAVSDETEQKVSSRKRAWDWRPPVSRSMSSTQLQPTPKATHSSSHQSCAEELPVDGLDGGRGSKSERACRPRGLREAAGSQGDRGMSTLSKPSRRRTFSEVAAVLLQRGLPVEEVIAWFEDDDGVSKYHHDAAQIDLRRISLTKVQIDLRRISLTKVFGHLGFSFEDVQAASEEGASGSCATADDDFNCVTSKFIVWIGPSAMSFEDHHEDFHENLRQIPTQWRSSLSSIMYCMTSDGRSVEDTDTAGDGEAKTKVEDGTTTDKYRRLEQQAPLEVLKSVIREKHCDSDDGDDEANAAAEAALAMGFMRFSQVRNAT